VLTRRSGFGAKGPSLRKLFLLLFLAWPGAAGAAVEIAFYSKELGASFPHAYVVLSGTIDATGEKIDSNHGFTARTVSPAVLMGSVKGEVMSVGKGYIRSSNRHFGFTLSDEEYRVVAGVIARWNALPQPSYNLNRKNCVFFVADVAAALGLKAPPVKGLMKKPHGFLTRVTRENEALIAARAGRLAPAGAAAPAAASTRK